jgi:hypothetical protein
MGNIQKKNGSISTVQQRLVTYHNIKNMNMLDTNGVLVLIPHNLRTASQELC